MPPERWQQVKDAMQEALALPVAERAAFLAADGVQTVRRGDHDIGQPRAGHLRRGPAPSQRGRDRRLQRPVRRSITIETT